MDLGDYPSPHDLEQSSTQSNLDLLINAISSDPVVSEQQILQQHLQQGSPNEGGGESTGYSLQEVLEGLAEGRRLEEENERRAEKRKAPERSSSVLDSISQLITTESIRRTLEQLLVPGNSLLTTIKTYHISTVQKSYGDEKRLFPSASLLTISPRPPYPVSVTLSTLFDSGTTSSSQTIDLPPSQDGNDQAAVASFKELHASEGKGGKAKKFVLQLDISPVDRGGDGAVERETLNGLVHAGDSLLVVKEESSNAVASSSSLAFPEPNLTPISSPPTPFLTCYSNTIHVLSKPTKTALKVKPPSTAAVSSSSSSSSSSPHSIHSNSLVSIFCRINSQTVRTRHLALDDRQRLSVLTAGRWAPFRIVASSAPTSHALHYGETVRLVDVSTGLQTEELRICRFEPGKAAAKGKGKAKVGTSSGSLNGGGRLFWNEEDGGVVRQLQKVGFVRVGSGGERWWLSSAGDGNQGGTPSTVAEDDEVEVREKRGERKRVRVRYEGSEEEGKRVGFSKGVAMKSEKGEGTDKEREGGEEREIEEGDWDGKEVEKEVVGGVDVGDDFLGWNLVGITEFSIAYFPLHPSLSSFPPPISITPFPTLLSAKSYRPSKSTIELLVADFLPPSSESTAPAPEIYLGSFGPLPYRILRSYHTASTENGAIFDEGEKRSHVLLEVILPKIDELPPLPRSSKDELEEQHHQHWDPSLSSEHVNGEFAGDWSTAGDEGGGEQVVAASSSHGTNSAGDPIPLLAARPGSDEEEVRGKGLPLLFVMRARGFGVLSGKSISIERHMTEAGEITIARVL
ncbi:hypothetical protein BDY24DRAFT_374475 [Mrakia frigida]|uniref:uncharacterized protein n=1 Tax=Mrakia frigida TaxID=29902 RepID=UPI003FCC05A2